MYTRAMKSVLGTFISAYHYAVPKLVVNNDGGA